MPVDLATLNGRKTRVVVVDDSRTMQAVLEQFFSHRMDFDVVGLAGDAETAVSMISDLRPDLVTIDFCMPYISGKLLLDRLIDFPAMHKVVISGSACGNLNIVSSLEQAGADACLDKAEMSRDPARFGERICAILAKPKRISLLPLSGAGAPAGMVSTASGQYPVPLDERARLEQLAALDLANDEEHTQFDRLTAHLARITDFPTCLMTFIDQDTQWIKSAHGYTRGSMPRALAFCNYTLCSDDILAVPDATLDDRFNKNPLVTDGPRVRAYIGHLITSESGIRLGAICLLDHRPRRVSPDIRTSLRSICEIAGGMIEARPIRLSKAA